MNVVSIKQQVEDFEKWKRAFDEHEPARLEHGIQIVSIYRGVENKNLVIVNAQGSSPDSFQTFFNNPKMKEAMERAGVSGAPEITYLEEIQ